MADESEILLSKDVLLTSLKSDKIRRFWSDEIKDKSFFSAQTTSKTYLEYVKNLLAEYKKGFQNLGNGNTISLSQERVRMLMREKLNDLGLVEKHANGDVVERMTNLGSQMRLDLIVDTNKRLAHSESQKITASSPAQKLFRPAFELVRGGQSKNPRNWWARWTECAEKVNYEGVAPINSGRMIALVDSPIWSELGHHYPDCLGTDMPPFAFGSQMIWRTVPRKTCIEIGLLEK